MSKFRSFCAGLMALSLSACMDAPMGSGSPTTAIAVDQPSQTYLFSWGMFGDPVFDRDVETFTRAYANAFGAPTGLARYGANSPKAAPFQG